MRPLIARRARPRPDPAPSRLSYRYERMMMTPFWRRLVRVGLPLGALAAAATLWASNPENREMVAGHWTALRDSIQTRPEFMVSGLAIEGADTALEAEIRTVLPLDFPVSSFDLDLADMRDVVAALNRVESASLRVRPSGVLEVTVRERVPVAVWRQRDGLRLIDATGTFVAPIAARADRPDLPLIAGDGAQDHLPEALELFATAAPLADRVRGLVRMGERRWDVVLDRGQRILLPEEGAAAALARVVVLHQTQELLDRDVSVVDMRNPRRPTLRLNPPALDAYRALAARPLE